jgi:hypothetical protein
MSNNKYEKEKIYKIWSTQGDKIYVGSTCKDYLSQRMTAHRGDYNKWKRGTHGYVASYILFEEYGLENCFIELLEAKSCSSIDEVRQLEGKYIRELTCVNKFIAGRSPKESMKEYYENNKEKIIQQIKEYQDNNKENVKQYKKKYRDNNKEKKRQETSCECGKTYQICSKARHLRSIKHCQFFESQTKLIQ